MTNEKKKHSLTVTVLGIGRVGLPFALVLADSGYRVYGIGRDQHKIEQINKGRMPFIERGAHALLKKHVNRNFFASIDYSFVEKSDYIILTLGTPVDENMNPVYGQINNSLDKALPLFKPNQTLLLRSTVSPGTTEYVKSIIENKTPLHVGENFFLAFCPERISEGNAIEETAVIPQIIGAIGKKSSKSADTFFKKIGVETLNTDATSAELAKLFSNMYRYINFAIANEFMNIADNYHKDIYEIVHLVNYKYKRGGLSVPGLTGGPCLFKDGFFLIQDNPYADLISTSWKINESVSTRLIKKVRERIKLAGKKVVILGLGYKAETDDIRLSLSFKIRKELVREQAKVFLHDYYVKAYKNQEIEKDVYQAVDGADVLIFTTNDSKYKELNTKKIKELVKKNCVICDIWNIFGTGKIVYQLNAVSDGKE